MVRLSLHCTGFCQERRDFPSRNRLLVALLWLDPGSSLPRARRTLGASCPSSSQRARDKPMIACRPRTFLPFSQKSNRAKRILPGGCSGNVLGFATGADWSDVRGRPVPSPRDATAPGKRRDQGKPFAGPPRPAKAFPGKSGKRVYIALDRGWWRAPAGGAGEMPYCPCSGSKSAWFSVGCWFF